MSRKKAIEICKNLEQTIGKMPKRIHLEHKNETFEIPRAQKNSLKKIKMKLMKKHKITEKEI